MGQSVNMEVGNQDVGADRPIKALVAAACQELHLVPDLAMHLAICDRISQNPYAHGEEAVKAIYKELDSRKPVEEHASGKKNSGFLSRFGNDDLDTQRKKEEVKELACILVKGWAEAFVELKNEMPLFMETYMKLQRDGVKFPQLIEEDRNYFTPPPVIPEDHTVPQPSQAVMGQAVGAPQQHSVSQPGMPNLSEAIEQAKLLKEVLQSVEPGANISEMDFVVELADAVKQAQARIQAHAEAVNDEATLMAVIAAVDHIDQALGALATLEAAVPGAPTASSGPAVVAVQAQLDEHDVQVQLAQHNAQQPEPAPASFVDHADMLLDQAPAPAPQDDLLDLFDSLSVPTTAPGASSSSAAMPPPPPQTQQPQQSDDLDLLGMSTQPSPAPAAAPTPPKKGLLPPPPSSKPRRKTPPKAKPADAHPAELNRQDSFEAFFGGELQPEPAAPAPAYNSNQTQPAGIQSHKPGVQ